MKLVNAVYALIVVVIVATGIWLVTTMGKPNGFCADMVEIRGARVRPRGRLYVRGELSRLDAIRSQTIIWRGDIGEVWEVFPTLKAYTNDSMPGSPKNAREFWIPGPKEATKRCLGSESVDGYQCRKYEFTYHDKRLGTRIVWLSVKLDWPLRIVFRQTGRPDRTIEFRDIAEGYIQRTTFNAPLGYKKMSEDQIILKLLSAQAGAKSKTQKNHAAPPRKGN